MEIPKWNVRALFFFSGGMKERKSGKAERAVWNGSWSYVSTLSPWIMLHMSPALCAAVTALSLTCTTHTGWCQTLPCSPVALTSRTWSKTLCSLVTSVTRKRTLNQTELLSINMLSFGSEGVPCSHTDAVACSFRFLCITVSISSHIRGWDVIHLCFLWPVAQWKLLLRKCWIWMKGRSRPASFSFLFCFGPERCHCISAGWGWTRLLYAFEGGGFKQYF